MHQDLTIKQLIEHAKSAEASGDLSTAAHTYERALKKSKGIELLYKRLMIIYRKLKMPGEELRIINAGIKHFQDLFKEKTASLYKHNRKISHLSKSILKSLQMDNQHPENLYEPSPIPEWKHRKMLVLHKLKKGNAKNNNHH